MIDDFLYGVPCDDWESERSSMYEFIHFEISHFLFGIVGNYHKRIIFIKAFHFFVDICRINLYYMSVK
jgi:hypothetical protein